MTSSYVSSPVAPYREYVGPVQSYTRTVAYAPPAIVSAPTTPVFRDREYIRYEEPYLQTPLLPAIVAPPPPPPPQIVEVEVPVPVVDPEAQRAMERLRIENAELLRQLDLARVDQANLARVTAERDALANQVATLELRWNGEVKRLRDDNVILTRDLDTLESRMALFHKYEADAMALELQLRGAQQRILELEQHLELSIIERHKAEELITQLQGDIVFLKMERDRLLAALAAKPPPPTEPVRPILGVEIKMLDDGVGGRDNVVVVHSVTPDGPAAVAGIRQDDVIQAWNGTPLDSKPKFTGLLSQSAVGSTVTLTVWRAGQVLQVPVKVGGTSAAAPVSRGKRVVKSKTSLK